MEILSTGLSATGTRRISGVVLDMPGRRAGAQSLQEIMIIALMPLIITGSRLDHSTSLKMLI